MAYSRALFDVITRDAMTAEKRLKIDVLALGESYDKKELCRIAWIPVTSNPADQPTKPTFSKSSPLFEIMLLNNFALDLQRFSTSRERKMLQH